MQDLGEPLSANYLIVVGSVDLWSVWFKAALYIHISQTWQTQLNFLVSVIRPEHVVELLAV